MYIALSMRKNRKLLKTKKSLIMIRRHSYAQNVINHSVQCWAKFHFYTLFKVGIAQLFGVGKLMILFSNENPEIPGVSKKVYKVDHA